ncbi:MAG: hypothetical protein ABI614_21965, partial [Planctomycetota bacterium]
MSHARLTFIGVATAVHFMVGCATPAWFAHGEFPMPGKQRPTDTPEAAVATPTAVSPQRATTTTPSAEPSLSQVLDDLERIKQQNPSDFAVIQSAVEDTSKLFPPQYQQTFKDQMLGVALQQQAPAQQPFVEQTVPSGPQPLRVQAAPEQTAQVSPVTSEVAQLPPQVSAPTVVAPTSRSIDVSPLPLSSQDHVVQTAAVVAQVSDMPLAQPTSAVQPTAVQPTITEIATATETVAAVVIGPGQWNREIELALASL